MEILPPHNVATQLKNFIPVGNGRQGKNGTRASRGRQAEFKTKVHGNGDLLIGHAYTKKLGLEPGQEFKIDLKKESKTIYLIPLN